MGRGLSELTDAVAGTYGDEGVRSWPALDKMAGGLAKWDRAIRAFETRLASELPGARRAWRSTCVGPWPECTWNEAGLPMRCESWTPPSASSRSARTFTCFADSCSTRPADPQTPMERFAPGWALDAERSDQGLHVFRRAATADNAPAGGAREILAAAYLRLLEESLARRLCPSSLSASCETPPRTSRSFLRPLMPKPSRASRAVSTMRRSPNSERPRRSIPC